MTTWVDRPLRAWQRATWIRRRIGRVTIGRPWRPLLSGTLEMLWPIPGPLLVPHCYRFSFARTFSPPLLPSASHWKSAESTGNESGTRRSQFACPQASALYAPSLDKQGSAHRTIYPRRGDRVTSLRNLMAGRPALSAFIGPALAADADRDLDRLQRLKGQGLFARAAVVRG